MRRPNRKGATVNLSHPGFDGRERGHEIPRLLRCPRTVRVLTASLRQHGWQPDAALRITQERAAEQAAQARCFDANTRGSRGWTRDVVAARETLIELPRLLRKGLSLRGLSLSDSVAERIRDAIYSMP